MSTVRRVGGAGGLLAAGVASGIAISSASVAAPGVRADTLEHCARQGSVAVCSKPLSVSVERLAPGQSVRFVGDAFAPQALAQLTLDAVGYVPTSVLSDPNGRVTGTTNLPDSVSAGNHALQIAGTDVEGRSLLERATVTVKARTAPRATGGEALLSLGGTAAALTLAAAGALYAIRRRSGLQDRAA